MEPHAVTMEPANNFTYGSYVLLLDRLLEHVEETKMQRAVNYQTMKDLELARNIQTDQLLNEDQITEATVKTEHISELQSKFEDIEKKCQVALAEKEQFELKYNISREENKTLRCDLVRINKERVAAQSKVGEVEAKLSVHCKGKETCLGKVELLQSRFTELNKTYSTLCHNISALENSFTSAKIVQKKLEFLVRHSNCMMNNLQNQVSERNGVVVKLKAAQIKDSSTLLQQTKSTESLLVDKQLISSLQHQLTEKTSEIKQLQSLLQTTKTSAQELSAVFVVEKTRCSEQTSQLEDQALRLQTEVSLVRAAVHEKERENEALVKSLNDSNDKVGDVTSELDVLKDMIVSKETSDTAVEATVSVADAACQEEPEQTRKEFLDQSVGCQLVTESQLVTEDMECQTEEVFFLTRSPTSPPNINNTSKRSPPMSPVHRVESTAKRLRSDHGFETSCQDLSPISRHFLKRLSLVHEKDYDRDLIINRNVTVEIVDNQDVVHSRIVTGDFEEDFVNVSINQEMDVENEPKTPEHLIDNETNRHARMSEGYRNDPDYSPIESPSVGPAAGSSESVLEIKESPLLGNMNKTSSLGTGNDSGIVEDYRAKRSVITIVESSSSDSDGSAAETSMSEMKPVVDRILNSAYRHVNTVMQPEKLNLYKASLLKSHTSEKSTLSEKRVSPTYTDSYPTPTSSKDSYPTPSPTSSKDSYPTITSNSITKDSFLPTLQECDKSSALLQAEESSACPNDYSFTQVARILKAAKTQIGESRKPK